MKQRRTAIRSTTEDKIADGLAIFIALFVLIVTVYPIYYCVIYAFSDGTAAMARQIYFFPVQVTLSNFKAVMEDALLVNSFIISVARTVLAVITAFPSPPSLHMALRERSLRGEKSTL